MRWNSLSIHQLHRCNRRRVGKDKSFHSTLNMSCDYLSMLGSNANHVGKTCSWRGLQPGHHRIWFWYILDAWWRMYVIVPVRWCETITWIDIDILATGNYPIVYFQEKILQNVMRKMLFKPAKLNTILPILYVLNTSWLKIILSNKSPYVLGYSLVCITLR